jgi:serpin B
MVTTAKEALTMKQFVLLTIIILLLVACTPTAAPSAQAELIQSDLPRLAEPQVDEAQMAQLVQGNNSFAFDLYQTIREESADNLIYSPYSISLAFSMVYAGARGQTEADMAQILHFQPQAEHHPAFNALDQYLASLAEDEDEDEENGRFQLNIANAVWGQVGLPFEEDYLATLAQQYGAGLRASNFVEQPEETRQEINDWIAAQTAERIQDILPPGTIDPTTRLVLANAIYFNAAWRFPFHADATEDGLFTLLDGRQVSVPLMQHSAARIPYAEALDYQVVTLPYAGQDVEMLVILPQPGHFEAIEAALSIDFLNEVRGQTQLRDVQLIMPRFEFDTDLDLQALLTGMGLGKPFGGEADFSGIVAGGGLYISDALHKGTITVDEEGTEAAAATVIVMAESALEMAEVTMNRPFIFAVMEQDTGTILFLGRVMNPA